MVQPLRHWTIALLVLFSFFTYCKKEKDDDLQNLALLYAVANQGCAGTGSTVSNATATLSSDTGCLSGQTTTLDSSLPAWIKDNFKCVSASVSGGNYVFRSQNVPNTKSYYFGSTSPMFESLAAGKTPAGTNQIKTQCISYTIPSSPAAKSGSKTGTQSGYVSVGITVNGLAIFNNAAAPGDVLASEVSTFDKYNGHPQQAGVYHHHALPLNISTDVQSDGAKLIGVLLDGFPVYGKLCDQGTADTADDVAPTTDDNHGHTAATIHFPSGIYHYHYKFDTTGNTNTLIGSFFHGTPGSVSN